MVRLSALSCWAIRMVVAKCFMMTPVMNCSQCKRGRRLLGWWCGFLVGSCRWVRGRGCAAAHEDHVVAVVGFVEDVAGDHDGDAGVGELAEYFP